MNVAGTPRKVLAFLGHDLGNCQEQLVGELSRICQADGVSMESLKEVDGLAFMQAVSKGCQMITLRLPEPRWPFLGSFAGTAAYAGYRIILVMGGVARSDADVRYLLQQLGDSSAASKLLSARPGQELLIAAAILAPILLQETQIGPGQLSIAGGSPESQQTQTPYQQALSQGAPPLLLPAPPSQEAADASSGQTQHFLRGMPWQHDAADQPQTPAASVVLLSTQHAHQLGSVARGRNRPENVGAQSDLANVERPDVAKEEEQECRSRDHHAAAEQPPVSYVMELLPGHAAPAPQAEARQPVQDQADIVDLVSSSSDDSRSSTPAAQQALQVDVQSAPREGAPEETLEGPAAAVRRSARISSHCSSDASDSEGDRSRAMRSAWLWKAQKTQAEADAEARQGLVRRNAPGEPEVPECKRSRLAASPSRQNSPANVLDSKSKTGAAAAREAKRKASAGGPDKAARRRGARIKSPSDAQLPKQHEKYDTAAHADEGLQEQRLAGGLALQVHSAEHAQEMTGSIKPQPAAQPAGTPGLKLPAKVERRHGSTSARQGAAKQEEQQHSKHEEEASTCLQASPTNAEASAGRGPSSKRSPGRADFPIKDWNLIHEKLRQNSSQYRASQAASQSQSPDKKRDMKGKGKMSAPEELRDPEQPGPSNAAYRPMQQPAAIDSDDDSIDLEKPPF